MDRNRLVVLGIGLIIGMLGGLLISMLIFAPFLSSSQNDLHLAYKQGLREGSKICPICEDCNDCTQFVVQEPKFDFVYPVQPLCVCEETIVFLTNNDFEQFCKEKGNMIVNVHAETETISCHKDSNYIGLSHPFQEIYKWKQEGTKDA